MTTAKDNDLAISHLSAEQKHHFLDQVLAKDDLKSFYNAMSSGDTSLVDLIIKYRGLEELPQDLESLLAESYARLKIQNVPLPRGMEVFVETKLIDLRFFTSKDVEDKKCTRVSLQDVKTRIKLTCLHAERIFQKFSKETGKCVDGEFILLGRFIAQNIHILKRQLKGTYTKLPWEEMEFLLVCFISAVCTPREADTIYQLVLDQGRLLKYLNCFIIKLQQVEKDLKKEDVSVKLALGNRSLIIQNILKESPDFEDMYGDHDLMKSVYSLKRIRYYIRHALDVNPNEGMEVMETLVLERTLQVVGESLKNTPDSPNVSEEVHQLLAHRAPRQARELSTALRDCLSHSRSYTRRPEQDALFRQRLREDLRKMDAEIAYILYRKKKDALKIFFNKVINCLDEEELTALIHEPDEFRDEGMNFGNDFTLEFLQTARGLLETLTEEVVDKTAIEHLFRKAEETLDSEENRIKEVRANYAEGVSDITKLVKSVFAGGDIIEIKKIAKSCLDDMRPEEPPVNIKIFVNIIMAICLLARERYDREALETDYVLQVRHKLLKTIAHRTFVLVEFIAGKIEGVDEFRNKIGGGPKHERESYHKVQQIFDDAVDSLDEQDKENLLREIEKSEELHRAKGELIKHFDSRLRGETNSFDGFASCVGKLCLKHKNIKDLEKFYEEGDYGKCRTGIQIIEDHYGKFARAVEELSLFSREKYAEACRAFFGTLKLKGKAKQNLISFVIEKKNQEISSYFSSRLPILDGLISRAIAEPRGPHQAAVEMLTLELTEILDNFSFFGDGAQFLDQFSPVLVGKNLRNYLAHGDPLADSLPSDPRTAVTYAASQLVREGGELIGRSDALIGGNIVANFGQLQQMYAACLGTVTCQDAMFDAIEQGNEDFVKDCVSNGVDARGADFDGWTGLHYAAAIGNTQILQFFLELGVNLDVEDIYGKTPFQIANDFGRINVIQHLIEIKKAAAGDFTADLNSLLLLAAKLGRADVVSGLLENESATSENATRQTLLRLACGGGHTAIVRLLLARGVLPYVKNDGTTGQNEEDETLLHNAAHNGHLEVVKTLLSYVDDGILMDFIRAPARNGSRALHLAAGRGHAEIVEELLARGSSIEDEDDDGQTPLHLAAANGFTTVIKMLLDKGAAIDTTENHLRTSLYLAAKRGQTEVVRELLDRGSDVRAETEEGYTALHTAAANGHAEILRILLYRGARIDAVSHDGYTALHVAVKYSHANATKCLINHAQKLRQCRELVNYTDVNNSTALHVAAAAGDEECARELLRAGATMEARDDTHCTPLHVAAKYGEVAIMRLLIENGCDVNAVTPDNNWSALLFAVYHDHLEAAALLIKNGIKLDILTQNDETVLHFAVAGGNKEMVRTVLQTVKKEDLKALINAPQKEMQMTALHFAVKNGYKAITDLLLSAGADVEAVDDEGYTALMLAASVGNMDVFSALLDNKANVNVTRNYGIPLLLSAAASGYFSIVKKLLELVADPHQTDTNGMTALHSAAGNGRVDVVELLLKSGLDINAEDNNGLTPLHLACSNGFCGTAKFLLRNNAIIDKRDVMNSTPLLCAAYYGHTEVVKLLLENGADVVSVSSSNSTALHLAANNESVARILLEAGVEVNAANATLNTALHVAAEGGHARVVSLLLDFGADPELKDDKGQTSLIIAVQSDRSGVVEELLSRKADVNAVEDATNKSALHVAVSMGNREIAQLLLNNEADVGCVTNAGLTPLHVTAMEGFHDIVGVLVSHGASVDAVDGKGWTALHHAAGSGNLMVVEELVKFGALNCQTKDGLTALKLAADAGHTDVWEFLNKCWKG